MAAGDIIGAYACRFKIEAMFRELEQQLGGFCYHIWTHAIPRLDRYHRKGSTDPLAQVKDSHQQQRVIKTLKATEEYVLFSSIAMGIIQLLWLKYQDDIRGSDFRYLRSHPAMLCRKPV
ncbi:MAG: hypothetical protein HFH54_09345 [Lachnospiraceae bacterium]|nr:hypothetical protein [Lachnospiraceae bacterium]